MIAGIANCIKPDAFWLVTDFAIPLAGWQRWHAAILIAIMCRCFCVTTGLRTRSLPDIGKMLNDEGLRCAAALEF